ncbi:hypothetical protein PYV02_01675 [Leifsonia sp. H3M29-4]|uniref:hypothetical protein n=1 Tax=Salinibacterium metalliresistens TaxID=3031321 RepID=UPI0023D996B3|nr:hypothetical protein [Salinibacterium metalliresistens]MDF1477788.1 hypothetical protein [Salinibacterium metalliresistens]
MIGPLVALLGLGLALNLSPTVYAVELAILRRTVQPTVQVLWLCGGLLTGIALVSAVCQVLDPATIVRFVQGDIASVLLNRWVDIAFGAVFASIGVGVLVRRHREPNPPHRAREVHRRPSRGASAGVFAFGLSNSVLTATGVGLVYVANRILRAALHEPLVFTVGILVFVAAVVGPYALVALLWHRLPGMVTVIERAIGWLGRADHRLTAGIVLIAIGAGLAVYGIGQGIWWSMATVEPPAT